MTAGLAEQQPTLMALARAGSERAKSILKLRLLTRIVVLVAGCGALFVPKAWDKTAYVLSVAALALEVLVWILNRWGQRKHELGESARRHAMLASAFRESPEPIEERDLRSQFSKYDEALALKLEEPKYYASSADSGLPRLSELLQESSFWSKYLYEKAASRTYQLLVLLLGGITVAALVALPTTASDTALLIARAVVVVLGVFIGMNVFGRARCWAGAARQTEIVYRRLLAAGARPSSKVLLGIFADYSVATASCAPIPTDLHRKNRERLNRLWAQREQRDHP